MKFAFLPCSREEIFAQVLLNVLYFVYVYIYIYIYQSHSSCIKTVPLFPCLKYEQSLLISSQASAKPKKILWCIQKNSTPHKTSPSLHFGHSSLHDDKGTIHCPTCMGDYQQDMNGEYDRTEYNT